MREKQRGTRTYADNAFTGRQQARNKNEGCAETNFQPMQDDAAAQRVELNVANPEGMQYLDIIQRFAL